MECGDAILPEAIYRLDEKLADLEDGSLSKELLLGGLPAINAKLSEEFAEVLAAFFTESDETLVYEAQSVIWLVALGLRARNLELAPVLQAAIFNPEVERKGDELNDAIRSYGDAKGRFTNALFGGVQGEVAEAGSRFIGSLSNLLSLRGINMTQVYERI